MEQVLSPSLCFQPHWYSGSFEVQGILTPDILPSLIPSSFIPQPQAPPLLCPLILSLPHTPIYIKYVAACSLPHTCIICRILQFATHLYHL